MMETNRERIYGLVEDIRETIINNEKEDGSFRFDALRIQIALEFVKLELEKSIEAHST